MAITIIIVYKTTNCFVLLVVSVEVVFPHDSLKASSSDQYLYREQVNKVIKDIRLDVIMELLTVFSWYRDLR